MKRTNLFSIPVFLLSINALAHPPVIIKAEAIVQTNQLFDIAVTIEHGDTGWEHYANEWVTDRENSMKRIGDKLKDMLMEG